MVQGVYDVGVMCFFYYDLCVVCFYNIGVICFLHYDVCVGCAIKSCQGGAKLIGTVASARPLNSRLYHVYSYKVYLSKMCFFSKV